MKTAVNLDDDLMHGAGTGSPRGNDADRAHLQRPAQRTCREAILTEFRLDLPAIHGRRMPTLDIDGNAALEEHLDRSEQASATP